MTLYIVALLPTVAGFVFGLYLMGWFCFELWIRNV